MTAFKTIVADPPWPYERASAYESAKGYVRSDRANRVTGGTGRAIYPTLDLAAIAALPVAALGADYLFLWTTGPFLHDARAVCLGWGFRPVSALTWIKTCQDGRTLSYGAGYWFRSAVEHVIVAKRPGARSVRTHERNAFLAPRGRHSAKPEALQDLIERHFPGPYLELFARRVRPGWACLGNELTGRDIRTDLAREVT